MKGASTVADREYNTPSIKDVAREARVSTATAGRVLGGYGSPSPKLVAAVHAAAERLGYRTNELARSMKSGVTRTLGVLVTDIENPFFAQAVKGMIEAASEQDHHLLISDSNNDVERERDALQNLISKQVDGVIISPASTRVGSHIATAQSRGLPIVLVDRENIEVPHTDSVTIDNHSDAWSATERLLSLGHRRIGLITEANRIEVLGTHSRTHSDMPSIERSRGFASAFRAAGINLDPELIATSSISQAAARASALDLIKQDPRITALFCTDNMMTAGAYRAIQDSGLDCPGEISILGFDDHEWSTIARPTLSVVAQPAAAVGRRTVELLLTNLRSGDPGKKPIKQHQPIREMLESRLIMRESVTQPTPGETSAKP